MAQNPENPQAQGNTNQVTSNPTQPQTRPTSTSAGEEDLAVINNVDIEIHSEDPEETKLEGDEKNTISQLIDDFRTEVSELAEFDKLDIYPDSAKLSGKIADKNIGFTLSAGDDNGFYLSSPSMLKIDNESLDVINRLTKFSEKFTNSINDILVNRRDM